MPSESSPTWRNIIAQQIRDPQERQRLADAIGVRPITLTRWAQGTNTPNIPALALYLKVAPQPEELLSLLLDAFPSLQTFSLQMEEGPLAIPATFYQQVLRACATTNEVSYLQEIGTMILQHAVEQLDPFHKGLTLMTLVCQPPACDGMVHSLRAELNFANCLEEEMYKRTAFVGAESLSGYCVTHNRPFSLQDSHEKQEYPYPFQHSEYGRSFCMYPIQRHHRVAGCLWVGSLEPHHFNATRMRMIEHYTNLMQLLFPTTHFYDLHQLQLQVLPPVDQQQSLLEAAPQHIQHILRTAVQNKETLTYTQAEQMVWGQMEEELITLAASL